MANKENSFTTSNKDKSACSSSSKSSRENSIATEDIGHRILGSPLNAGKRRPAKMRTKVKLRSVSPSNAGKDKSIKDHNKSNTYEDENADKSSSSEDSDKDRYESFTATKGNVKINSSTTQNVYKDQICSAANIDEDMSDINIGNSPEIQNSDTDEAFEKSDEYQTPIIEFQSHINDGKKLIGAPERNDENFDYNDWINEYIEKEKISEDVLKRLSVTGKLTEKAEPSAVSEGAPLGVVATNKFGSVAVEMDSKSVESSAVVDKSVSEVRIDSKSVELSAVVDKSVLVEEMEIISKTVESSVVVDKSVLVEEMEIISTVESSVVVDKSVLVEEMKIISKTVESSAVVDKSVLVEEMEIISKTVESSVVVDKSVLVEEMEIISKTVESSAVVDKSVFVEEMEIISTTVESSVVVDKSVLVEEMEIISKTVESSAVVDKSVVEVLIDSKTVESSVVVDKSVSEVLIDSKSVESSVVVDKSVSEVLIDSKSVESSVVVDKSVLVEEMEIISKSAESVDSEISFSVKNAKNTLEVKSFETFESEGPEVFNAAIAEEKLNSSNKHIPVSSNTRRKVINKRKRSTSPESRKLSSRKTSRLNTGY